MRRHVAQSPDKDKRRGIFSARRWYARVAMMGMMLAWSSAARALEPADIVVLFNNKSMNSLQVARYYMNARKIPETHLIPITCDVNDNISEADYRTKVVPQVVKALTDRKLMPDAKAGVAGVKCIVTTYDVPLRVMAREPSRAERDEIDAYQRQLGSLAAVMEAQAAAFDRLAAAPATQGSTAAATKPAPATWQQAAVDAGNASNAAGQRVEKLPPDERTNALAQFVQMDQQFTGIAGVLNVLHIPADVPEDDPARRQLADMSARLQTLQESYQAQAKNIDSATTRRQMVTTRQTAEGLVGEARAIEDLMAFLKPDETEACFDNELALVLADQSYLRHSWIANPKNVEIWPSIRQNATNVPPVLLVARIDGSSVAKTKEMIDTTIKTEAKGLEGKIYLDARGLHGTDGYALFDADIRRAADWLKQHATIDVVLDDKDALLKAQDCPDAALYCGWYSLRLYQDSCQWVPGGVGYHVASHELQTLHGPNEMGWVVNLLNRGYVGSLGATDEPFLNAFPKPSLFFPLLLSGQFTQGEVWELTSPMVSWQIGYVGDPLYNPYKVKPRVKVEDLKQHTVLKNAFDILER